MNRLVEFNTSALTSLVGDLNNAADILTQGAVRAVNQVAADTRKNTVLEITAQVNLKQAYVDRKVEVSQDATVNKPQAILEVADEPISLASYGAQQQAAPNDWTFSSWIAETGGKPSILPNSGNKTGKVKIAGWMPRRGDALRGIAPGAKAAGINIRVSNSLSGGGNQTLRHVFLQTVLSGKVQAGRWGAFSHERTGKKAKAMYGPSAYQITKGVWRDMYDEVGERLEEEVSKEVSDQVEKALGRT